jgi:hypothetical protein
MKARIASWAAPVVVFVLGCGETAKPPATDPESLRKLEELQKNAAQGEKSANPKKKAGR